jgi:hypothetical protein
MNMEDVDDMIRCHYDGDFLKGLKFCQEKIASLESQLAARAEAERLAVWAVRHRAHTHKEHPHSLEWEDTEAEERAGMDLGWSYVNYDGTDADLLRALRVAAGLAQEGNNT